MHDTAQSKAGAPHADDSSTRSPEDLDDLLQCAFRYALSLSHDPAEAEDLVQDACASILGIGGPWQKTYLFTAVRNHFIDRYRRRRKLLFLPLEGGREQGASPIDELDSGDWEMPDFIAAESLHRALGKLRPAEREVMFLAVVEELTAREIAVMTSRPRGTILCLMHRSRKKLRRLLDA